MSPLHRGKLETLTLLRQHFQQKIAPIIFVSLLLGANGCAIVRSPGQENLLKTYPGMNYREAEQIWGPLIKKELIETNGQQLEQWTYQGWFIGGQRWETHYVYLDPENGKVVWAGLTENDPYKNKTVLKWINKEFVESFTSAFQGKK